MLIFNNLRMWLQPKNLFLSVVISLAATSGLEAQEKVVFQLIDNHSKTPIPYAYIKVIGKNIIEVSDVNGFFSIGKTLEDSVIISHIAYHPIRTTIRQLAHQKLIEMNELTFETNPIIISAKSAKLIVERAIDSSFKALYKPMYLTCFRLDQLLFRDTLRGFVKAEIIYVCKDFFFPSYGGVTKEYLKNIIVYRDPKFTKKIIPSYSIPTLYAPINRFIIGASPGPEKHIYYSNQEANDSIQIIGINPKQNFVPRKYILKYGRFIINKNTGRILQIDTNLSPEMMDAGREINLKSNSHRKYPYFYSVSYFFNWDGIISKVLVDFRFTYKEDNPDNMWQNYSEIVFINNRTKPTFNEENLVKRDTLLIQMNSKYDSGFEMEFNKWISEEK